MAIGNISSTGTHNGGGGSNHYLITILFDAARNGTYSMSCQFIYPRPINNFDDLLIAADYVHDVYNTRGIMVNGFYRNPDTDKYATAIYITCEHDTSVENYTTIRCYVKCIEGNSLIQGRFVGQIVFYGSEEYGRDTVNAIYYSVKI